VLLLAMAAAAGCLGQSSPPAFDVVSVKHAPTVMEVTRPPRYFRYGPELTRWTCDLTLGGILQEAFGRIEPWEIDGPRWIHGNGMTCRRSTRRARQWGPSS
jgi:hypothetical protein